MRTAIKAALSVKVNKVRRDYFEKLQKHLDDIMAIYEQEGRSTKERQDILCSDLRALGEWHTSESDKCREWLIKWEKENPNLTPSESVNITIPIIPNEILVYWIEDLITGFAFRASELGVILPLRERREENRETLPFNGTAKDKGIGRALTIIRADERLRQNYGQPSLFGDDLGYMREYSKETLFTSEHGEPAGEDLPTPKNTPKEKNLFRAAIDAGLMEKTNNGYFWNRKYIELAYFLDGIYTNCLHADVPNKWANEHFEYIGRGGKRRQSADIDSALSKVRDTDIREKRRLYPDIAALFEE